MGNRNNTMLPIYVTVGVLVWIGVLLVLTPW